MKRSGNHGIINWLKTQGDFLFCNNIVPIAPILKNKKVFPEPVEFNPWLNQRYIDRVRGDDFSLIRPQIAGTKVELLDLDRFNVILSLEDQDVMLKPFVIKEKQQSILILRDVENMLASRLKRANKIDHPAYPPKHGFLMTRLINTWKSHAREFLGISNHLPNKTNIYFNAWFEDRAYRKTISKSLGLNFNDQGFTMVSKEGGGSSFDGVVNSGQNHLMQVLNRVSSLSDSQQSIIHQIMQDNELNELNQQIKLLAKDYISQ